MAAAALAASCGGPAPSEEPDAGADAGPDPFADRVVSFTPGASAGYGQDRMPGVVLGAPRGKGDAAGSTDVVSLGREGELVLAFEDVVAVDGDGPDLVVFENVFSGFVETARVAASDDGVTWHEWRCAADDAAGGFPGCAGLRPVYSSPGGIAATEVARAGGDAFDLAEIGLARARFVRLRDTGTNAYEGISGGFDLDAVVVVNGEVAP